MAKSSSLKTTIVLATLQVIALAHTPLVQRDEKPIKLVTDLVMVDATVTDKDGRFIRKLKTEDFVIYENGEAQKIDFFEATEEASLTASLAVVVAIDNSGSIKPEEIARQREATESFVKLVRPESLFAIIAFNSEIRVLQDFTSVARKISRAFQRLGEVGGSSRIFGSIDRAISMLKRGPRFRNGRRLRRVVIVLTDGYDNVSPPEQSEMIRRANDAEVTVYSITLPSYLSGGSSNQRAMTLSTYRESCLVPGATTFRLKETSRRCSKRLLKRFVRATQLRTIRRRRVAAMDGFTNFALSAREPER